MLCLSTDIYVDVHVNTLAAPMRTKMSPTHYSTQSPIMLRSRRKPQSTIRVANLADLDTAKLSPVWEVALSWTSERLWGQWHTDIWPVREADIVSSRNCTQLGPPLSNTSRSTNPSPPDVKHCHVSALAPTPPPPLSLSLR